MYLHVYRVNKRWKWCVYDGNEQIIARSTRSYSRLQHAKKSFYRLRKLY